MLIAIIVVVKFTDGGGRPEDELALLSGTSDLIDAGTPSARADFPALMLAAWSLTVFFAALPSLAQAKAARGGAAKILPCPHRAMPLGATFLVHTLVLCAWAGAACRRVVGSAVCKAAAVGGHELGNRGGCSRRRRVLVRRRLG